MKKLTSIVTAALMIGCPSSFNSDKLTKDLTIQDKLEDIRKSVHCIRQEVEYVTPSGVVSTVVMHGTAFVYDTINGMEYVISNEHVVSRTPEIYSPEPGIVLTKQKDLVKLVLSGEDNNPEDDIILERIDGRRYHFNSERNWNVVDDTFVLKANDQKDYIYQSGAYEINLEIKPRISDTVYVLGCREADGIFLLKGVVSNESYNSTEESDALAIDISTEHGSSGSPVFIERDGKLYLVGQIRKFLKSPMLGIATKVNDLVPYWLQVIENDRR